MANPEHLDILKKGVDAWNLWRRCNRGTRPDFRGADLSKRDLKRIDFSGADLRAANLCNAFLSEAVFKNADLLKVKFFGSNLFETDLGQAILIEADLRNAVLVGANLAQADLSGAVLSEADLRRADLRSANLRKANLRGDYLMGDRLRRTDLRGADLSNADLSNADLRRVNLKGNYFKAVNLKNTDFKGALMHDTILSNNDLSQAKNLDKVHHYGPSKIGIDTIDRSRGNIPEAFLRGCGLSEWEIAQAKLYREDLTNNDIIDIHNRIFDLKSSGAHPYRRCVIIHSQKDEDFAKSLHENLQQEGVRCWTAPEGLETNSEVHRQTDADSQDNRLLILSDYSMSSDWISLEIKRTRIREKIEDRQILIPLSLVGNDAIAEWERVDAKTAVDLAAAVRSYRITDFSRWKEEGISSIAFKKLMGDIKT